MVSSVVAAETVRLRARGPRPGCMVWRREFPGSPENASEARQFVQVLLAEFCQVGDVVQVAGELIANALRHTRSREPGGAFVVEVRRWPAGVALAVTDQGGPTEPCEGVAGELAESGYGLGCVRTLSSWMGWRGDERGRTVTAVFARHHLLGEASP